MATNTGGDEGPSGKCRRMQMEESSEMLPELPNAVWTLVLGKLEAVGDLGRLQQVSQAFNAAIADIDWIKIKTIKTIQSESESEGSLNVLIRVNDEKLLLPKEKRVLLMAELAKKATNISEIEVEFRPGAFHESKAPLIQEFVEFVGCALDKLAPAALEIQNLDIQGDLVHLSPMFPSLAEFIHANTQTVKEMRIWDFNIYDPEERAELQIPWELLDAIRQCSQLETANIGFYPLPFNVPLLESILSGKSHLKKLAIHARDVPATVILDSGVQLVEFHCSYQFLLEYAVEVGRRGLAAIGQHPLRTVKESSVIGDVFSSLSVMPNLERLGSYVGSKDVEGDIILLVSLFLTRYENTPGSRKVLTWDMSSLSNAISAQELAEVVQEGAECQATVKATEVDSAEVMFSRGNASLICHVGYLPIPDDAESDEEEGSEGDA